MKSFLLVNHDRTRKDSIGSNSLKELIDLAKIIFNLDNSEKLRIVLENDGFEIIEDESLMLQDEGTSLMVLEPGQNWEEPKIFPIDIDDFVKRNSKNLESGVFPTVYDIINCPALLELFDTFELSDFAEDLDKYFPPQQFGTTTSDSYEPNEIPLHILRSLRDTCDMNFLKKMSKME